MKKVYIIIIIAVFIIIGGYLGLRYGILRTKDQKPDNSKAKSALDLRPSIIAKMQQLVKDGSSGLYHLSIGTLEPNLRTSTLHITNAALTPDSAAIKKLHGSQKLPDDIFKINFAVLEVEGININDLLTNKIALSKVKINNPLIEVYHQVRPYNTLKPDTSTVYQKVSSLFRSIAIDKVEITGGRFISHDINKGKRNQVNDVSVILEDLLLDSSTQYDKKRKLFAKKLELSVNNYTARSPDSLYHVKFGAVKISGVEDKLTLLNVEIKPRFSKAQFQKQLIARKEMFNILLPRLSLSGINWWQLFNEGSLIAHDAVMENARCSVYLDRSLPFRKVKPNNFPHQMLMQVPVPISIAKLYIRNAQLVYTEFNPAMDMAGTIRVDNMNGQMTNITNMPERISQQAVMTINSSGLFMRKIPLTASFRFNLAKYKTGEFSMNLQIKNADSSILNPSTIPMAEFMLKKGVIQKGTAQVTGNNFKTHGKGELLYTDLYLVAVKREKNKPGNIDKRGVLSFIANAALIKNNNPSKDEEPRRVNFDFVREAKLTFFSLVWKTIFIGILKTIGLPESFADKTY